ncbi:nucleoside ABC transporter membrane protein [Stackebrandtia albiflava]|uniref:Nucleoside ABC transporter membrane protein n=1 Tax=Stackebrandtia albiflava TaxID=406432 RepID=A0A562V3W1_9ACTN|nr:ABC transporter permease [Stackebrandtia albiflava]TWJ12570.1 nucleoside ABC transporter membrane protein [Stackebrandtia albiflava]
MTTIDVAESAESTALHGFWTRSRKVGTVLAVLGIAVFLIGLTMTAGAEASVRFNLTLPEAAAAFPAKPVVLTLGAVAVLLGALLLTGRVHLPFGLTVGVAVAAVVLALLIWAIARPGNTLQIDTVLKGTMLLALPLIFGSLSGVLCERSGIINVGIEGQFLAGAFTGALAGTVTGSPWVGILAATVAGALVTFVLAALAIRYVVDQVVLGVVLNLLVLGLTGFLFDRIMKDNESATNLAMRVPEWQIPILSDIPAIGPALFGQNVFVYLALVLVALVYVMLFHTRWGLRTRAVGEHPVAADTVGIKVNSLRFRNVLIAGLVSGLGGAFLTIGEALPFSENMTDGKGFIALAVLIVGRWNPIGGLLGALLFGFAMQIEQFLSSVPGGSPVPSEFLAMLPYLVTIVAVAGLIGRVRAPAADGKPYTKA